MWLPFRWSHWKPTEGEGNLSKGSVQCFILVFRSLILKGGEGGGSVAQELVSEKVRATSIITGIRFIYL